MGPKWASVHWTLTSLIYSGTSLGFSKEVSFGETAYTIRRKPVVKSTFNALAISLYSLPNWQLLKRLNSRPLVV